MEDKIGINLEPKGKVETYSYLGKLYNPREIEDKWGRFWIENNLFHAYEDNKDADPYSIVIPPPNITGSLHIGHALNNTLQDVLARWKRMDGFNVLWLPGTDHAGIATQNIVEKRLIEMGQSREDITREEFIDMVWKWKAETGSNIINQLKKLGASCDWQRERFTMDEGLSNAVKEVFICLYREGLIYKDDYIINWCPRCKTAISDLEVEYIETNGKLYMIKYPLASIPSAEALIIATTRPETIFGDTAVAVNPNDKRNKRYVGMNVVLPIINREIKVIEDDYVDANFGSGVLKITPSHDLNDFEIGKRHNIPSINVINEDGSMNENAGKYQGLDRFDCRREFVTELQEKGYLVKTEDYRHAVGHCYRCNSVIEPRRSIQWFLKTKELAKPAIRAVKSGKIQIIPKMWEATYFEWMKNIRDWCISRQIWWGHRIPAWECKECKHITVSKTDVIWCEKCNSKNIIQETDVLDTWFSSALWPFSTMGWPEMTKELSLFYPTSTLVTSFDILFFWVARMIMMGLKFMANVPFKDVYIHALIRDEQGQKMSKSKGNVIDPLVMMDKYGTDAFRFALIAFAAQGRDIRISEERIEGYRHFTNKVWNMARFILSNIRDISYPSNLDRKDWEIEDHWIISRLQRVIKDIRTSLDEYKFNEAAHYIYQFIWHELCDWYIELIKPRLASQDRSVKETAQHILYYLCDNVLRLLHPFMPFITEEIWQYLNVKPVGSICTAAYPKVKIEFINENMEMDMEVIMNILNTIRNIRGEMNLPPSVKLDTKLKVIENHKKEIISKKFDCIKTLGRLNSISFIQDGSRRPKFCATSVIDADIELFVVLKDIINIDEEKDRLLKELKKVQDDLYFLNKKLANREFKAKAPKEVVKKDEEKQKGLLEIEIKIKSNIEKLSKIS